MEDHPEQQTDTELNASDMLLNTLEETFSKFDEDNDGKLTLRQVESMVEELLKDEHQAFVFKEMLLKSESSHFTFQQFIEFLTSKWQEMNADSFSFTSPSKTPAASFTYEEVSTLASPAYGNRSRSTSKNHLETPLHLKLERVRSKQTEEAHEKLTEYVAKLEGEKDEFEKKYKQLLSKFQKLQKDYSHMTEEFDTAKSQMNEMKESQSKHSRKLRESEKELKAEITQLSTASKESEKILQQELDKLKQKHAREISNYKDEIQLLKLEKDDITEQLASMMEQQKEFHLEIRELRSRNDGLTFEKKNLFQQLETYEDQARETTELKQSVASLESKAKETEISKEDLTLLVKQMVGLFKKKQEIENQLELSLHKYFHPEKPQVPEANNSHSGNSLIYQIPLLTLLLFTVLSAVLLFYLLNEAVMTF